MNYIKQFWYNARTSMMNGQGLFALAHLVLRSKDLEKALTRNHLIHETHSVQGTTSISLPQEREEEEEEVGGRGHFIACQNADERCSLLLLSLIQL